MADAFYQFDKDGTGKINKAELKEMLEFQMGVALDDVRSEPLLVLAQRDEAQR